MLLWWLSDSRHCVYVAGLSQGWALSGPSETGILVC